MAGMSDPPRASPVGGPTVSGDEGTEICSRKIELCPAVFISQKLCFGGTQESEQVRGKVLSNGRPTSHVELSWSLCLCTANALCSLLLRS